MPTHQNLQAQREVPSSPMMKTKQMDSDILTPDYRRAKMYDSEQLSIGLVGASLLKCMNIQLVGD